MKKPQPVLKLIEAIENDCPGCNFLGNPGIMVVNMYDEKRHYHYAEKIPCPWCKLAKDARASLEKMWP